MTRPAIRTVFEPAFEPAFDCPVAPGGYAWWYLDALSDDGTRGITVIAFIGSVFSPYYAWARRRARSGAADPLNHCAVNVALYGLGQGRAQDSVRGPAAAPGHRAGPGPNRWAMTERGRRHVHRDARTLRIGPSSLRWDGAALTVTIDEVGVPWPSRLRGTVRLVPARRYSHPVTLSDHGDHRWCPIAPSARVEVDLSEPGLRWSGAGYLDSNRGDAPLEQAFTRWDWSRGHLADGRSAVFYDIERIDRPPLHLGLRFDPEGRVATIDAPAPVVLPRTGWRLPRTVRSEPVAPGRPPRTLTDAPFYARSLVDARWLGEPVTAMHESLSLTRFDTRWVQAMLPFRMPRVG